MATIQLTFTHPQGNLSRTKTLADADLVRVMDALKDKFKRTTDASPLTNVQAFDRFAEAVWGQLRTMTKDYEDRIAKEAVSVAPINATD
jgi:uncharacterized protein YeeX (DUF496 family)